jgi:nitronate monooxygenase
VATDECDADIAFKQAYVNCKQEDIGIIQSPVGMPGRAILNSYVNEVNKGNKQPTQCPFHCITTCKQDTSPYCISLALINACKGRLNHGFAFIGAKGYLINEIVPVHQLFADLAREYAAAQ